MYRILVINPGSTSTELSIFEDEKEISFARIIHPADELRKFGRVIEQFPYRLEIAKAQISEWGVKKGSISAVVGRSGLRSKEGGAYRVNQKMIDDIKMGKVRAEHAAILGCLLARDIAEEYGVPAFVAHPSSVYWDPMPKVSGMPLIERRPLYHLQNIEPVARLTARDMNRELSSVNLVVAHLQGGMSIAALQGGRVIDATSALDEGPFTMERSGGLPGASLVELCFSGKYTREQILKMMRGEGGMVAYLGTNKIGEVESMIERGNEQAAFYLEAMCYQIAKDIGAMATVLQGKVDAVILTGKILESERAVRWIRERVAFIAPVMTYPEQEAMEFARAGLSVLRGEAAAKNYE